MGSGQMDVLATPSMIALMEAAARNAVEHLLPPDHLTIGTHLDVQHFGATPVGSHVIATAELIGIDGRMLSFRVVAHDDKEIIGEGTHERAITGIAGFRRLMQRKMKRTGPSASDQDSS